MHTQMKVYITFGILIIESSISRPSFDAMSFEGRKFDVEGDVSGISEPGTQGEFIVLEKDFMERRCVVEITVDGQTKKVIWFLDYPLPKPEGGAEDGDVTIGE